MISGQDQPIALTPELIIYRQIERIHQLRAQGLAATESLYLLSSALGPLRTDEYNAKTKQLVLEMNNGKDTDETFYAWYEILISILSRNGYWLVQRGYLGWEE